jgi:hypothetical protein
MADKAPEKKYGATLRPEGKYTAPDRAAKTEMRRNVNKANANSGKPGRILAEDGSLVPSNYYSKQAKIDAMAKYLADMKKAGK